MLEAFGNKIFKFFGEKDFGFKERTHFDETFAEFKNFHRILDLFPYEHYDPKHQLFFNMESVGFVLEMPPLVGASDEMQKEISGLFQHLLPEGSSLQFMLFADPNIDACLNRWQKLRSHSVMQSIAKLRVEHLKKFAFKSPNVPYALRDFRCIISFSQAISTNPVTLANINQLKNQLKTTFEMLGLPVSIWEPSDLINTISSIINMNPNDAPAVKRWNNLQNINEQIATLGQELHVTKEQLMLQPGDIAVRTYQATHMPSLWSLHAMGQLIGDEERDFAQIPCPFIIHYGVHVPTQGQPRAKVLTKATYVERQASSPIGKYLPSIQIEAEELSFVRAQIGKGERIVQTELSVTLLSSPQMLANAEQILLNLYFSKEYRLQANNLFHLPMFLSTLPMMWSQDRVKALMHYKKLKTTLSTEASNLLPMQGEWKGTATLGILLGGRRGQLMSWYPFDNQAGNYNVCVVGRSGAGKSMFMQELMSTTLGFGGRVFVMDVGRSFENTCQSLSGQFIEFKANTPLCLNPFSTIPTDNLEVIQDALAMLKSVLILMAAPTKGVDDLEASLLEQAIKEAWDKDQQNANITKVAEWLANHADPKANDLSVMLYPFTESGSYGRFFNGKSNVNLDNPLVVVELEELKQRRDLQGVIVQMFIINVTNQVFLGDRKTPFTIVFDEAWDLLRGEQSGVFIETLARRLRRYYGSLVVGTQSVNDLFATPAAQAAFDNSDWMCLLSQKKESIDQLKKASRISLTPAMEAQLKSVKTKHGEYSEIMIYGSHGFAIGRLLLDPYSGLLYSSKAADYSAIKELKEQGLELRDALETILKARAHAKINP
jgi:conjugal transfer ATP-binding protein TraC